jgi:hypothetical protein
VDPQKFKALQQKWYRKLAKHKDPLYPNGFVDIEDEYERLREHSVTLAKRAGIIQGKYEYFDWARSKIKSTRFKTRLDRRIWVLHSEGFSFREIAEQLDVLTDHVRWRMKVIKRFLGKNPK